MLRSRARLSLAVAASGLALLALIFPPWRATAIRTTTRYAAVPGLAPSTVVDTLVWPLQFAPLYAPPRPLLTGARMSALASSAMRGDTAARALLSRSTRDVERRAHAPEVLRADGALWRDSVLTAAGIPAMTSYDLSLRIDQPWLAARLAVLALVAFILDSRMRRRRSGSS